ncbi:MAG: ribosome-associated translation inhibitor RaiA [Fibromonadaceae bacterium]|jgi:putative sigma-54 modulation protein|nr:ribosome-associated translation inhibitor RaiA [Fibromonadaceae bacterium]
MSNIPINVTVRHLNEPSSKFQSVIQSELGKLESHFGSVSSFSVVVEGISKIANGIELSRRVEITAAAKGNSFAATAEEENFGKALDSAIAKIKAQLSKQHEKASDHKSIPTAEVAVK